MSELKGKKKSANPVWLFLLFLVALALVIKMILQGNNVALLNPKGFIAQEQYGLMIYLLVVLFAIAIPSVLLVYYIAWKYRESNTKATHAPDTKHSKLLDLTIWGIPGIICVVLAFILFPVTQRLEPGDRIVSDAKPLTVQVVALQWKWLFIYPEQDIATVNYVQVPVDRPVEFELTADQTPMSGFWIPNLGGMLYAMTGHVNKLNLMAEEPGDYPGSTAEVNGAGFAGMKFTARASSEDDFNLWVQGVKQSPDILDASTYADLLKPTENHPGVSYSSTDSMLYDKVLMKYSEPSDGKGHGHKTEHAGH